VLGLLFVYLCVCFVLGIETSAPQMLSPHSTTDLYTQPMITFFSFESDSENRLLQYNYKQYYGKQVTLKKGVGGSHMRQGG
jgi:hypothetical protein